MTIDENIGNDYCLISMDCSMDSSILVHSMLYVFTQEFKLKNERPEHLEVYDGNNRFSFVNATIWQCIKFWLITKLTGGVESTKKISLTCKLRDFWLNEKEGC